MSTIVLKANSQSALLKTLSDKVETIVVSKQSKPFDALKNNYPMVAKKIVTISPEEQSGGLAGSILKFPVPKNFHIDSMAIRVDADASIVGGSGTYCRNMLNPFSSVELNCDQGTILLEQNLAVIPMIGNCDNISKKIGLQDTLFVEYGGTPTYLIPILNTLFDKHNINLSGQFTENLEVVARIDTEVTNSPWLFYLVVSGYSLLPKDEKIYRDSFGSTPRSIYVNDYYTETHTIPSTQGVHDLYLKCKYPVNQISFPTGKFTHYSLSSNGVKMRDTVPGRLGVWEDSLKGQYKDVHIDKSVTARYLVDQGTETNRMTYINFGDSKDTTYNSGCTPFNYLNYPYLTLTNKDSEFLLNWVTASATAEQWSEVTWSPELNMTVAVAASGTNRVMYSYDGITWNDVAAAEDNSWKSVCWSREKGMFVAVASSGTNRVMYSTNGTVWQTALATQLNQWVDVCWSSEKGLFVAVSIDGVNRVMYSDNGTTWVTANATQLNQWQTIGWSREKDMFVALSSNGTNRVMYSNDGIAWSSADASHVQYWRNITWADKLGKFVAVGVSSGAKVMYSDNGIDWTSADAATSMETNQFTNVAWSPELSVLVACSQTGTNTFMYSYDAKNWVRCTAVEANYWSGLCWSAYLNKFISVALTGTSRVAYTPVDVPYNIDITYRYNKLITLDPENGKIGVSQTM